MKKKPLIIAGAVVAIIVIAIVVRFLIPAQLPTSQVTFKFARDGIAVDVFANDEEGGKSEKITTVTSDSSLSLKQGAYYYIASGENIAPTSIKFDVVADKTVEVNPTYTDEYLAFILDPEVGAINDVIKQTYPLVIDRYDIQRGRLYQQGQWFGTTLIDKQSTPKNPYDPYRIVLQKENGKWETVTKPELLISSLVYPGIPTDILQTLNRLDPPLTPEPRFTSFD